MIEIYLNNEKIAVFKQDNLKYLVDYNTFDIKKSITLSLPNTKRFYIWDKNFPPYFESFLPEGYLFEIFKNILSKEYGYIDDFLLFSILSPNIEGRIKFKNNFKPLNFSPFDIDEILNNDTKDTFTNLLHTFLDKNAISGIQPKTVAIIKDKETFTLKEYIVKTWGKEFPYLAENEYLSLQAVKRAGIKIPNIQLSKNKNFLLIENFIFENNEIFGFEEVLSLMNKNRINKYQGSYEQVSKIILQFSTNKAKSLKQFFKIVVMNFLLKNGDAHLKNFGLLFKKDFSEIWIAPAYDIVTTTAYIFKDKPALTLDGKKIWHSKKVLINFGKKYCLLTEAEAQNCYDECINALKISITKLEKYILQNPHFTKIGKRMLDSWRLSLQNQDKGLKEIGNDIIRTWRDD